MSIARTLASCPLDDGAKLSLKQVSLAHLLKNLGCKPEILPKAVNSRPSLLCLEQTMGRYLLCGSMQGALVLHDTHFTGKFEKLNAANKSITAGDWYPFDTGIFATGSLDQILNIWDSESLQNVEEFKFDDRIFVVKFCPGHALSSTLAVGSALPFVHLCDLRSGNFSHILKGHKGAVYDLEWSKNNDYILFTGSNDNQIKAWDIRMAGSTLSFNSLEDRKISHREAVRGLRISSDGTLLISFGGEGSFKTWNQDTGQELKSDICKSIKVKKWVGSSLKFGISNLIPGNPLLYYPDDDCVKGIYLNSATDHTLFNLRGHVKSISCLSMHPFEPIMYTGAMDHEVIKWRGVLSTPSNDTNERISLNWTD